MIPIPKNSNNLIKKIQDTGLYQNFIEQLIKDFELTGLSLDISKITTPDELVNLLQAKTKVLMEHHFDRYLQLLYRVDISETTMQNPTISDTNLLSKKATLSILQREWQKVYFKDKYS